MSDIKFLAKKILEFRNELPRSKLDGFRRLKKEGGSIFIRQKIWQFLLPWKAAEVLEHFQWKNEEEIKECLKNYKDHIGEELSDVLWWVLLMSHDLKIDIKKAFLKKMAKNEKKYPVEKSKGKNLKWDRP